MQDERQALTEFLLQQCAIPSVKGEPAPGAPFGEQTLRALEHFLGRAAADGFRTRVFDGYAGCLEFGPEEADCIAGICHLDVVPPGDWAEAFAPRIEDGRLIARGSIDDKGPAVAVYMALKRLKDKGYRPRHRLQLVLGLDEESGSQCMRHYCAVAKLPVAAFTADAEFPVIHAEKGILIFKLRFAEEALPGAGGLRLSAAEAGSRANVIPGSCRLSWSGAEAREETETVEGVMGHASMPQSAKNAISLAMARAGERLAAAGGRSAFVEAYGKLIGLSYAGEGLDVALSDAVSGALTLNAGVLHFDGAAAELICDIRYPVTFTEEEVAGRVRRAAEKLGVGFERLGGAPPLYFPKDHPLVSSLLGIYRRLSGSAAEPLAIGGGTYARSVPNTLAFGPAFPDDEMLAHQKGEYAALDGLCASIDYYEEAFMALDAAFA